jgi:D-3-phosphoglycerate dehydrogenase / 2-oxoglutarate reductase
MTDSPRFTILAADRGKPLDEFDRLALGVGAKVVYGGARTSAEMDPLVGEADAVIVFRTPVTAEQIAKMRRCRIIVRQGIGFDLIDVPAATRAGIFVSNVPDYCIDEVADHAMTLLLAVVRNLMDYHRVMTTKGWGYWNESRTVPPLSGMRLGLVGLGKIGRGVARRAAAFGFDLKGYDPYVHDDVFTALDVGRVRQLEALLESCDAITVHTPLTPETQGMLGEREFARMRPGSYFVNTARGKIVDLNALDAALASGHIAAAGLDVFEDEPLDAAHPILKRPNLIATPHVAFYSERSIRRVVTESIEEVLRALRGERPLNLVNPEVYAHRRRD